MSKPLNSKNRSYPFLLTTALLLGGSSLPWMSARASSPTAGTVIENQATGSYIDEADNQSKTVQSDKVIITVAEIAGITVTASGNSGVPSGGNTFNFDFTITNTGNDPTQLFIPGAPSSITGVIGATAGSLSVIEYDPDGSGSTAPTAISSNNTVPNGGAATGSITGIPNGGSIPVGGILKVRVPINIPAGVTSGSTLSVTLGNTTGQPSPNNTPYVAQANDLYTQDNADGVSGEASGSPINGDTTNHRQEGSASQSVVIDGGNVTLVVTVDADGILPINTTSDQINTNVICTSLSNAGCDNSTFNTNNPGGTSATNGRVRTNDYIRYKFNYSVNSSTPSYSTTPQFTTQLPAGIIWTTLPGQCLNPVANTNSPSATQSAFSTDKTKLTCYLGPQAAPISSAFTADALVGGNVANATSVNPTSTLACTNCIATVTDPPTAVAVTALPRWNLRKIISTNGASGANYLVTYSYIIGVDTDTGTNSLPVGLSPTVGNEALANTITFTDDFTSTPAVNYALSTCTTQNFASYPFSYYNATHPTRSVVNSGTPTCAQSDGAGTPITVTITGADTSLSNIPSANQGGGGWPATRRTAIVNPVTLAVPLASIPAGGLPTTNTFTTFDPVSISGQSNFGAATENIVDNSVNSNIPGYQGYFEKSYTKNPGDNPYVVFAGTTLSRWSGTGYVAPNEIFTSVERLFNQGAFALSNVAVCDIWDNSKSQLVDITPGVAHQVKTTPTSGYPAYTVEYGTASGIWPPASYPASASIASECGATTGWYSTPDLAPGGRSTITKARLKVTGGTVPAAYDLYFYLKMRAVTGLATDTIIPNFGTYSSSDINSGAWASNTFVPTSISVPGNADKLRLGYAQARISKNTYPNNTPGSVTVPNGQIEYELTPNLTTNGPGSVSGLTKVRDLLPPKLTFVAGSGLVNGVANSPTTIEVCTAASTPNPLCTQASESVLTWDLGSQSTTVALPKIRFKATADATLNNAVTLRNTAIIETPEADPTSTLAERSATRDITTSLTQGLLLSKTAPVAQVLPNTPFQYVSTYRNTSTSPITSLDLIDVLPFVGDGSGSFGASSNGRAPATSFSGTLGLSALAATTSTATWYFTNAAAATINKDPSASTNLNPGSGGSIWCAGTTAGPDGSCGYSLSAATGIRLVDGVTFATNSTRSWTISLNPSGNKRKDVYTNDSTVKGASLLPVISNDVTVEVIDYELKGFKSVALTTDADSNSKINSGDTLTWRISYANTGDLAIANFMPNDPLPTGLTAAGVPTVVGLGGASGTVNGSYTGAAGATANLLSTTTSLPVSGILQFSIPVTINTGISGVLSNQATATGTGISVAGVKTDNIDTTTTGLPAGVSAIGTAIAQTQTATVDPTTVTVVAGNAKVLLVKRITRINGLTTNPNDGTVLTNVLDNPATANDDPTINWLSGYLVGAYSAGKVKPGDEIEYTVYFLNAQGADANAVKICDRIIGAQQFLPDSTGTLGKGIQLQLGNSSTAIDLTNASDSSIDRAQFHTSSGSASASCNLITPANGVADNGTLEIDITGTGGSVQPDLPLMPGATAPGTPTNSYGLVRFKTKVNP
jgi:uncharacterized repeat protein (TIGR01451 family)